MPGRACRRRAERRKSGQVAAARRVSRFPWRLHPKAEDFLGGARACGAHVGGMPVARRRR